MSAAKKTAGRRVKVAAGDDPLMTAADYARVRGSSRQAASRMVKRHGIKLDEERRAPLSVWRAADAIGRMQDKNTLAARVAGLPEGGLAAIGHKAKIKKMSLEIDQLQMAVDRSRGELIDRKEAERAMAEAVGYCLLLMDQVLENWAAEVREPEQFEKLRAGMDRARAVMADKIEEGIEVL